MKTYIRITAIAVFCYPLCLHAIPIPLPVFDSRAINNLIEQVNEAKRMVEELKHQIDAITGKNKTNAAKKDQLNSFLPTEWRDLIPKQEKSNIQLAGNINQDRTAYLVKKFALMKRQFDTEAERLQNIQQLAKEINETQDIKAAQDLQNKIQAEQMSYQENIHQFQVMKSLFEVEEKLAERRSELEIKCRNARYLHLKRPNDPSFDLPYECIHLNSVPKFRGIYSKVEKKELDGEDSSRIGEHVRQYESGKAGSGAVSSGKGDPGGVSYGTYQLSSKTGDAKKFISWSAKHNGAGKEFEGLKPGTSAFNQKWKEVNKRNPASWGKEQYDFIYQTHYKPQVEFLKKRGIDVNKLGKAEKEAVWSAAIQYGSHTNIIAKAFEGRDIYSMSSEQRVNSIYDYKWKTRKSYFRRAYSNGSGSGIENRIRKERMTVLGILQGK